MLLTVGDVAEHYALRPDTVRAMIRRGDLHAVRINRNYRLDWPDVWACEQGPMPGRGEGDRYKTPLLSKSRLASVMSVSVRTIERWIADGLPTRSVLGSIRISAADAEAWCRVRLDVDLPADWWR